METWLLFDLRLHEKTCEKGKKEQLQVVDCPRVWDL